jgi:cytochrome c-type biogenesis protein CcmH
MRFGRALAVLAMLALAGWPALAVQPHERLADPALEQRAREVSAGLRCLVCQNQSIDDSDAPLARDLRALVRDRIKAGDSNGAVIDFVVARYGEYVLLKPPFGLHTLLLWFGPFLLLLAGAAGIWRLRQSHRGKSIGEALDDAEKAELARILEKR